MVQFNSTLYYHLPISSLIEPSTHKPPHRRGLKVFPPLHFLACKMSYVTVGRNGSLILHVIELWDVDFKYRIIFMWPTASGNGRSIITLYRCKKFGLSLPVLYKSRFSTADMSVKTYIYGIKVGSGFWVLLSSCWRARERVWNRKSSPEAPCWT